MRQIVKNHFTHVVIVYSQYTFAPRKVCMRESLVSAQAVASTLIKGEKAVIVSYIDYFKFGRDRVLKYMTKKTPQSTRCVQMKGSNVIAVIHTDPIIDYPRLCCSLYNKTTKQFVNLGHSTSHVMPDPTGASKVGDVIHQGYHPPPYKKK